MPLDSPPRNEKKALKAQDFPSWKKPCPSSKANLPSGTVPLPPSDQAFPSWKIPCPPNKALEHQAFPSWKIPCPPNKDRKHQDFPSWKKPCPSPKANLPSGTLPPPPTLKNNQMTPLHSPLALSLHAHTILYHTTHTPQHTEGQRKRRKRNPDGTLKRHANKTRIACQPPLPHAKTRHSVLLHHLRTAVGNQNFPPWKKTCPSPRTNFPSRTITPVPALKHSQMKPLDSPLALSLHAHTIFCNTTTTTQHMKRQRTRQKRNPDGSQKPHATNTRVACKPPFPHAKIRHSVLAHHLRTAVEKWRITTQNECYTTTTDGLEPLPYASNVPENNLSRNSSTGQFSTFNTYSGMLRTGVMDTGPLLARNTHPEQLSIRKPSSGQLPNRKHDTSHLQRSRDCSRDYPKCPPTMTTHTLKPTNKHASPIYHHIEAHNNCPRNARSAQKRRAALQNNKHTSDTRCKSSANQLASTAIQNNLRHISTQKPTPPTIVSLFPHHNTISP